MKEMLDEFYIAGNGSQYEMLCDYIMDFLKNSSKKYLDYNYGFRLLREVFIRLSILYL